MAWLSGTDAGGWHLGERRTQGRPVNRSTRETQIVVRLPGLKGRAYEK